jgi:hypothetical protein
VVPRYKKVNSHPPEGEHLNPRKRPQKRRRPCRWKDAERACHVPAERDCPRSHTQLTKGRLCQALTDGWELTADG